MCFGKFEEVLRYLSTSLTVVLSWQWNILPYSTVCVRFVRPLPVLDGILCLCREFKEISRTVYQVLVFLLLHRVLLPWIENMIVLWPVCTVVKLPVFRDFLRSFYCFFLFLNIFYFAVHYRISTSSGYAVLYLYLFFWKCI